MPAPKHREAAAVAPAGVSSRKLELQLEARRLLEQDRSWHAVGPLPPNMRPAASPRHVKELILGSQPGGLIVVDYFAPSCQGCRMLFPKLKQIARRNADVLFVTVDVSQRDLGEMAANLGAPKLPWFQLFRGGSGGDILASFTANVSTVSRLRDEIAAHTECLDAHCSVSA